MLHDDLSEMLNRVSPTIKLIGRHSVTIIENTARLNWWQKSFEHRGLKTLYLGTPRGFTRWKRKQARYN